MQSEDVPLTTITGCHGSVSSVGLGGRACPGSGHGMPDPLLGSSQVAPLTVSHTGARYKSTMVGLESGGGCRFSTDAKAEADPAKTSLGLLTQH